ncbi:methyltransferase [Nonomuraea sp. NPDC002799]
MPTDHDQHRMLTLLTGAWTTQALATMAQLGLAEALRNRRLTSTRLAEVSGTHAPSLRRLLRFLVSHDVLDGDDNTGYGLTPLGEHLTAAHQWSQRDLALMYGGPFYTAWADLTHAVQTGDSAFEHAFAAPFFDYARHNPQIGELFDRAMACGSGFFAAVPQVYDFRATRHVADLAGGNGTLLAAVLTAHPHLQGTLFDTASVIDRARTHLHDLRLDQRCAFVAGDLFTEVPAGADVYLLSRILHDWDDEQCAVLLRNCRQAMRPGDRLLILERLLPADGSTDGSTALTLAWDLHMLVINGGGRERTLTEYQKLIETAGLRLTDRRPLPLPLEMNILITEPAR